MLDATVSKQIRAKWLLEICEELLKKFVSNTDELTSLVAQTTELEVAINQDSRWMCRANSCGRSFAYHSGRVR